MNISYADKITHNSRLSQFIQEKDYNLGFEGFKHYWNSISDIHSLFNENIFKQTIALNINHFNNQLIHQFVMSEAKLFFQDKFLDFKESIRDFIFTSAIQEGHIQNIQIYAPKKLDVNICLQIAIKYNSWESFTWFLTQHVPEKNHKKTIQWTHQEFWKYRDSGYTSFEFLQNLVKHPLSQNKPVKQGVYNLINNKDFYFLNQLIQDDKCFILLRELNVEHYYKLLLKQLSDCRHDSQFTDGLILLTESLQCFNFDFSKPLFNVKFKKENPDLIQFLDKAQLRQKLDLLPEKPINKKLKI